MSALPLEFAEHPAKATNANAATASTRLLIVVPLQSPRGRE
jgi:hypothetical protein